MTNRRRDKAARQRAAALKARMLLLQSLYQLKLMPASTVISIPIET